MIESSSAKTMGQHLHKLHHKLWGPRDDLYVKMDIVAMFVKTHVTVYTKKERVDSDVAVMTSECEI